MIDMLRIGVGLSCHRTKRGAVSDMSVPWVVGGVQDREANHDRDVDCDRTHIASIATDQDKSNLNR